MLKELISLANELDRRGLIKEANTLDGLLGKIRDRVKENPLIPGGGIIPSNERGEEIDWGDDDPCEGRVPCAPGGPSSYPQGGQSHESSRDKTSARLNETFEIIIPPAHDMSQSWGERWELETNLEYNDQVGLIEEKDLGYRKIYTFSAKGSGNTRLVFSQFSGGGTRTGVNHVHEININ